MVLLPFIRKSNLLIRPASAGVVYVPKGLDHPEDLSCGNLTVMRRMVFLSERKRSPKGKDYVQEERITRSSSLQAVYN